MLKSLLHRFADKICAIMNIFHSREDTHSLGKFTLLCFTVTALLTVHLFTIIYPISIDGYANKFEYEHSIGQKIEDIELYNCNVEHHLYKSCSIAKYKITLGHIWTILFSVIILFSFSCGFILLIIYLFSWFKVCNRN